MATASKYFLFNSMESRRLIGGHPEYQSEMSAILDDSHRHYALTKLKSKMADEVPSANEMPPLLFVGHQKSIKSFEKTAVHPKKLWSYSSTLNASETSVEKHRPRNHLDKYDPESATYFKHNLGDFERSVNDVLKSTQRSLSIDQHKGNDANFFLKSDKAISIQGVQPQRERKHLDGVHHLNNEQPSNSSSEPESEIFVRHEASPALRSPTVDSTSSTVTNKSGGAVEPACPSPTHAMLRLLPTDLSFTGHKHLNCINLSPTEAFDNKVITDTDSSESVAEDWNYSINEGPHNEDNTATFGATQVQEEITTQLPTSSCFGCEVCGEAANGNFFGANVCLPCKSFFIRCTKNNESCILRQCSGKCNINKHLRNRCQFCRYQRCLVVGMTRKEKPESIQVQDGQELCRVCGDLSNGIHFGVFTCEGCKKFYRRGLKEHNTFVCKERGMCHITPRNRNSCRLCRYQKCISVGMSRTAIKMGRPRKLFANWEFDGANARQSYPSCPSSGGYFLWENTSQQLRQHNVKQIFSNRDHKIQPAFKQRNFPLATGHQFGNPSNDHLFNNVDTMKYGSSLCSPLNVFNGSPVRKSLKKSLGQPGDWNEQSLHGRSSMNKSSPHNSLCYPNGSGRVHFGSLRRPNYESRNYNSIDNDTQYTRNATEFDMWGISRVQKDKLHPHVVSCYNVMNAKNHTENSHFSLKGPSEYMGHDDCDTDSFCNAHVYPLGPYYQASDVTSISQRQHWKRNVHHNNHKKNADTDAPGELHPALRVDNQYPHSLSAMNYIQEFTNKHEAIAKTVVPSALYRPSGKLENQDRQLDQRVSPEVMAPLIFVKTEADTEHTPSPTQIDTLSGTNVNARIKKYSRYSSKHNHEFCQQQRDSHYDMNKETEFKNMLPTHRAAFSKSPLSPSISNHCDINETKIDIKTESDNLAENESKKSTIPDVKDNFIIKYKPYKFEPSSPSPKPRQNNGLQKQPSYKHSIKRKLIPSGDDFFHDKCKKSRLSPEMSHNSMESTGSDTDTSEKSESPPSSPCKTRNIGYDPYTNEQNFQEINSLFASKEVLDDTKFQQFHYSPQEVSTFWQSLAKEFERPERDEPKLDKQFDSWLHHIKTAYTVQLQTSEEGLDSSSEVMAEQEARPCGGQDVDHWRQLQERIARQTFAETRFVLDLARVGGFLPTNVAKLTLNSSLFGNTILMASREWFDSEQGLFRTFWNWNFPNNQFLEPFQNRIVCLGKRLCELNMDVSEVALLSALNIANPSNVELHKNEQCVEYTRILLALLTSHLQSIGVCPSERIPDLLSVMAPLRHMSMWFSNLIKNMRADPSSLDKTLYKLSHMAVRASVAETKPKERLVWRIPG